MSRSEAPSSESEERTDATPRARFPWDLRPSWPSTIVTALAFVCLLLMGGVAHAQADIEQCFVEKVNAERTQRGLGAMAVNQDLVVVARRHSRRMADAGSIFHNQNLAAEAPAGWKLLGENVGVGPTCESLHRAFMNSQYHRENILESRFNFVGMGVVVVDGPTIYITEQFMQAGAAPPPPPPPSPTPSPQPPPSPQPSPPPSPKPPPPPKPSPSPPPPPPPPPSPEPSPSPSPPPSSPSPSPTSTEPGAPVAQAPAGGPSPVVLAGLVGAILLGAALVWALTRRRR